MMQDADESPHRFELHGWKPDPALTEDEFHLYLVFLITRMGALIVRPKNPNYYAATATTDISINRNIDDNVNHKEDGAAIDNAKGDGDNNNGWTKNVHNGFSTKHLCLEAESFVSISPTFYGREFSGRIIWAGTNTPLYDNNERTSDIYAEINAYGKACTSSSQDSTVKCTADISIPPSKRCFAELDAVGIKRIVTRQASWPPIIHDTTIRRGIEVRYQNKDEKGHQMERINRLVCHPERTDQELTKMAEQIKQERRRNKKMANTKRQTTSFIPSISYASSTPSSSLSLLPLMIFIIAFVSCSPPRSMVRAQHQQQYYNPYESSSYSYASSTYFDSSTPVRVSLSGLGVIQGVRSHNLGLDFFGGIPFAAAPVGNLRWAPPQVRFQFRLCHDIYMRVFWIA